MDQGNQGGRQDPEDEEDKGRRRRKRRAAAQEEEPSRQKKKDKNKTKRRRLPIVHVDSGKSLYELAVERMKTRAAPLAPPQQAGGIGELKHSGVRGRVTAPFVKTAMETEAVVRAILRHGRPIMQLQPRGSGGPVQEIDLLLPAKVEGCVRYKELRAEPEFQRRLLRRYIRFLRDEEGLLMPPPPPADDQCRIRWCEAYLDPTITRHLEMEAYERHLVGLSKAKTGGAFGPAILALAARFNTAL